MPDHQSWILLNNEFASWRNVSAEFLRNRSVELYGVAPDLSAIPFHGPDFLQVDVLWWGSDANMVAFVNLDVAGCSLVLDLAEHHDLNERVLSDNSDIDDAMDLAGTQLGSMVGDAIVFDREIGGFESLSQHTIICFLLERDGQPPLRVHWSLHGDDSWRHEVMTLILSPR